MYDAQMSLDGANTYQAARFSKPDDQAQVAGQQRATLIDQPEDDAQE